MGDPTLENEFKRYKAMHKYKVLKAKMIRYYIDLKTSKGEVNLPPFIIREQAEEQAEKDLREMLIQPDGLNRFNSLYEIAWDSMGELMD